MTQELGIPEEKEMLKSEVKYGTIGKKCGRSL